MRRLLAAAAAASSLALLACTPIADAGAGAELASAFQFSAYPNGALVQEFVYGTSLGPFAMPGTNGYRVYQTDDAPGTVKTHYENLGKTHQWLVKSQEGSPEYGPSLASVNLSRDNFFIDVTVSTDATAQGPYPAVPPPIAPPSPSPSTGATPAPAPTPSGPYFVRINVNVR